MGQLRGNGWSGYITELAGRVGDHGATKTEPEAQASDDAKIRHTRPERADSPHGTSTLWIDPAHLEAKPSLPPWAQMARGQYHEISRKTGKQRIRRLMYPVRAKFPTLGREDENDLEKSLPLLSYGLSVR